MINSNQANSELISELVELRQALRVLRGDQRKLRSIVERSIDGILLVDEQGIVVEWNQGMERIFGITRAEALGRMSGDVLSQFIPEQAKTPDHHPRLKEPYSGIEESGQSPWFNKLEEVEIHLSDGARRVIQKLSFPVPAEKGFLMGSIIHDVTERRWAEQEQKRLEQEIFRLDRLNLIGEMAAGVSHEIRNPITIVRGFLQVMQYREQYAEDREFFELMIGELDRASLMISEFLSMARHHPIVLGKKSLNTVLKTLHPLLQADAAIADKSVALDLGEIPDLEINEKEIRQLILNLARNGLEAMPPGGRLTISTRFIDDEIRLTVNDQGHGIASHLLPRLGTPFLTTKDTGTGLGLTVCHSIAAQHNAAIEVDTGPDGTTFCVRFKV